ncbi:uncharacterized protein LOC144445107 isoform X2 [Glandiceps talaboti]
MARLGARQPYFRYMSDVPFPKKTFQTGSSDVSPKIGDPLLQSRLSQLFQTVSPTEMFDFDKGTDERIRAPLSKIIADLQKDDVDVSVSALQELSTFLSENGQWHERASQYLSQENIPETLATKVHHVAVEDRFTNQLWNLLSGIYNVILTLIEDDGDNSEFISTVTEAGFAGSTRLFLENQYVFEHHSDKKLYVETTVSALKTLEKLVLAGIHSLLPTIQTTTEHELIREVADKYSRSGSPDVSRMATQLESLLHLLSERRQQVEELEAPFQEFLRGPGIDMSGDDLGTRLSHTLRLCTKRNHFWLAVTTDKYQDDWFQIISTVSLLASMSHENLEFINEICTEGILDTVYDILSKPQVIEHVHKTQKMAQLVNKLLILLLTVTKLEIGRKYLCSHNFTEVARKLLNSLANTTVKVKALGLNAILHDLLGHVQIKSEVSFEASESNIDFVSKLLIAENTYNCQMGFVMSRYLVDSSFVEAACLKLRESTCQGGCVSIPRLTGDIWRSFHSLITCLAKWVLYDKHFAEKVFEGKTVEVLKAILKYDFKKDRSNQEIEELIKECVVILIALAYYGHGEAVQDKDTLDQMNSYAKKGAGGSHTVSLKFYATTFLIIMHPLASKMGYGHFPNIIDKKNPHSTLQFISFFVRVFEECDLERAWVHLTDYVSLQNPLKFIKGTFNSLINANIVSLPNLIRETQDKFQLLDQLARLASSSTALSSQILTSEFMRLFQRLIADGDIIQAYTSMELVLRNVLLDFFDVNSEILLILVSNEQSVKQIEKFNFLEKLLFFVNGKMLPREVITVRIWAIIGRIWLGHGRTWPPGCGISGRILTDKIILPDTLRIIKQCFFDAWTGKRPRVLGEMFDQKSLATRVCKEIGRLTKNINIHSDRELDKDLVVIIDFLFNFCKVGETFSLAIDDDIEYQKLLDKVLGSATDPQIINVDQVGKAYVILCLRVLLMRSSVSSARGYSLTDYRLDLLKKWLTCQEHYIQFLVISILGKLPMSRSIITYIEQIDLQSSLSFMSHCLEEFAVYGRVLQSNEHVITSDSLLKTLCFIASTEQQKSRFAALTKTRILTSFIERITKIDKAVEWKDDTLKYAVTLLWILSTNTTTARELQMDATLLDALTKLWEDNFEYIENETFSAILSITGKAPKHVSEVKECYDVAMVSPDTIEDLASEVAKVVQNDNYRVQTVTLSSKASTVIDTIDASQFAIFLFNEETEYSAMCRTVANHAQRTRTPYLGVFVGDVSAKSWEHSIVSPQNKLYLSLTKGDDTNELMSAIRHQLPNVNISLIPDRQEEESRYISQFNSFAQSCDIGDVFVRDNFIGSVFDHRGGNLMLSTHDVVLYIPPGAIEAEKRQPVYCHGNEYKYGDIHSGKVVLAPVVHCGPDGAVFRKEVVLTFPHSAVNADSWNFTALNKTTGGKWNEIPDGTVLVKDEYIHLFLDHFTGFTAEGDAKAGQNAQRRIKIGARGEFCGDKCCKVHIGAWWDTGAKDDEGRQVSSDWQECSQYTVSCKDQYIKIAVTDLEDGWKQRGSNSTKMIHFADIGTDRDSDAFYCQHTFRYSSSGEKPDDFFSTINVSLDQSGTKTPMELVVPRIGSKAAAGADTKLAEMSNPDLYRRLNEDVKPLGSQISEQLWRYLCEQLDVSCLTGADWKGFAGRLGLRPSQISALETKENPGPTSRLLGFYFSIEQIRSVQLDVSLDKLAGHFKEIGHDHACTAVMDFLKTLRSDDVGGDVMSTESEDLSMASLQLHDDVERD